MGEEETFCKIKHKYWKENCMKEQHLVPKNEYNALVRLKKAGVRCLIIEFSGSGDDGYYNDMDILPSPQKTYKELTKDIKTLEEYLHYLLLREHRINFNDEGCSGYIYCNLDEFFLEIYIKFPTQVEKVRERHDLAPLHEMEGLIAETENLEQ